MDIVHAHIYKIVTSLYIFEINFFDIYHNMAPLM